MTAIKKKEGVGEENLNEYKRKCNQEANKNTDRSKRIRLANAMQQDKQDGIEAEEEEQDIGMDVE